VIRDVVKTSVIMSRKLWTEAKMYALKEGITLAKVIQTALEKYLEEEKC